jgi:TAF6 C-terminal HEAT repeat domain
MQASAKSSLLSLVEDHLTGLVQEALSVQRHAKRARLHEPDYADVAAAAAAGSPASSSGGVGGGGGPGILPPYFQDEHYDNGVVSSSNNVVVRRRVHAADIIQALQLRGCETLYATPVVGNGDGDGLWNDGLLLMATTTNNNNNNNKKGNSAAENGANNASSKKKVVLKDFLQRECYTMSQDMAPTEIAARMHWLAVDGKQPEIPQNPPPLPNLIPSSSAMYSSSGSVTAMFGGGSSNKAGGGGGFVIPNAASAAAATAAGLEIFQLQSAVLSEELQLYFTRVALAMERGSATPENEHQQDVVLQSLACDSGLQELVPFLVRYCQQQLYKHSRRGRGRSRKGVGSSSAVANAALNNASSAGAGAEHCRTLVRLATSMLRNPHLHLELQLHELLPALMTCVVTDSGTGRSSHSSSNKKNSRASASGAAAAAASSAGRGGGGTPAAAAAATLSTPSITIGLNSTSHWALRREASLALLTAWQVYGEKYVTLKADALKALCQAIGPDRPLATRYGGFVAISCFGPKAIDAFLLPSILACWKEWETELEQYSARNDLMQRSNKNYYESSMRTTLQIEGVRMCQQAALDALNIFLNKVTDEEKAARLSWNELEEPLGDRLVALNGSRGSPYAMCFI